MFKRNIKFIGKVFKKLAVWVAVLALVFPLNFLVVLADPVPVEEVGANLEENTITAELRIPQNNSSVVSNTSSLVQMLGEIMAPIYQLSTPGSGLTYDVYRYLMKHTENELGIDKDFFRRMQRKQTAPTVDIVFAPTNPKVGEKVTAFAVPRGFRNDKNKLYYTWYIVHGAVTGNESLSVEDGKKEAMRLVAAGNYDKDLFGEPKGHDSNRDAYNASFGGDDGVGKKTGKAATEECEGCQCIDGMTMFGGEVNFGCFDDKGELLYSKFDEYDEAVRDRGEASAKWGRGVVNSEWISRCYRHNFGAGGDANSTDEETGSLSGRDLIIKCQHAFGDSIGDRNFLSGEEEEWGTNPEDADTDGDGVVDEADLAGLGQDEFTWTYQKGDKVSVAVEGMSNIPINEGATERLRYKNKHWDGEAENIDLSPMASPEKWYKDARQGCEDAKNECLASTGHSLMYTPVADRLPSDGECIAEYSDCMKDLWEHQLQDENDEDAFGQMTGYYKIMWAAPGICSENRMDEAEKDWCDSDSDFGFQYLKLYDPVEQGKKLFEVSVNVSPKNPQFSEPDSMAGEEGEYSDSTDLIIANADVTSMDNVNPDYLYYKWSVWRCDPEDINTCEEVTDQVKFKSYKEGLGVRDIGFYPTAGILEGSRALLKIGVVVKRHKNATMSSPGINGDYEKQYFSEEKKENYSDEKEFPNKYAQVATKLVQVTENKLKMNLYMALPDGNGGWEQGPKICMQGLYKKICPVFPYEVLMAEVEGADGAIAWKVNGHSIMPSNKQGVNDKPDAKTVFFPVMGAENSLGRVTVTAEEEAGEEGDLGIWGDNNLISERVFSIHSPIAVIVDAEENGFGETLKRAYGHLNGVKRTLADYQLWWALALYNSSSDMYQPDSGGYVSSPEIVETDVPITVVPLYLEQMADVFQMTFKAYINDKFRDNINTSGARMTFKKLAFSGVAGVIDDFRIRTRIEFNDDYRKSLWASFGVKPLNELVTDLNVKVKNITAEKYKAITGGQAVVLKQNKWERMKNKFFASTIRNTPKYLIFSLRLAISIVLVMGVSFGVVYYGDERWN